MATGLRPPRRLSDWGFEPCNLCSTPSSPESAVYCDWGGCIWTACRKCHPKMEKKTLWCPQHRPPGRLPILGWQVAGYLWHPGRRTGLGSQEEVSDIQNSQSMVDGAADPLVVAAQSLDETTRARAVAEAKRFRTWLQNISSRKSTKAVKPSGEANGARFVMKYVHGRVLASRLLSPRLQVNSPSTPKTWVRLLAIAYPGKVSEKERGLSALLKGYHALAPALRLTERGVQESWDRALRRVWKEFETASTKEGRRLAFALWLTLELQMSGLRPLAAARGSLPQATRVAKEVKGQKFFEVSILLDKDNVVGQVPAPRKRLIPWTEERAKGMALLPYPNDQGAIKQLLQKRVAVLRAHGIKDARSSRRDALTAAEAAELDPGAVGNHRPGSASTPRYILSATSTAIQLALAGRKGIGAATPSSGL